MSKEWQIIISGSGGQGVILAGIILASAALADGKNVIQTQSYGPEARGGASRSEVLISEQELSFPKVQSCNLLVALTQQALDKYVTLLEKDGVILTDTDIETSQYESRHSVCKVPIFDAVQTIGRPLVANIVTLGALNGLTKIVDVKHLETAIAARVPKPTIDLNLRAVHSGYNLTAGKEG
ncbi:MAG: 2-oxoacid:ferredoxin oxidoreductase subunit gamma [Firmicutes bacterium]|nr:2-oxoacid:ferredoxin oxidoreductase subunit gamma [Bacillota bacterium]